MMPSNFEGHIYGAPINDHGQNWIFYSKRCL